MSLFFIGEHFFECSKSALPFFREGSRVYTILWKKIREYTKKYEKILKNR